MGFAQIGEEIFKLRIHLATVGFKRTADHVDPAVRVQGALERLVGLQADDCLQLLVNIARPVRGNGGRDVGVKIHRGVGGILLANADHHLLPQRRRCWRRLREESFIAFIRGVVMLNKIAHVNGVFPFFTAKPGPCVAVRRDARIDCYFHQILALSGVSRSRGNLPKTEGIQRDHFFFIGRNNRAGRAGRLG